jgi:hypothetical protein
MRTLERLAAERDRVDQAIREEVHALRVAGFAWSAIAADLQVTRQAAQQRYGHSAAP